MDTHDGQVAIITGAARGIGAVIAAALAEQGAAVCLADLDGDAAEATAAELRAAGRTAVGRALDVADGAAFDAAARWTAETLGEPTVLVNNAGLLRSAMAHRMTDAEWDLVHDVVLRGTFNGARAVAPWFRRTDDIPRRIVNISSVAGLHPSVGGVNYAAAKAGVVGLTRALSAEWARFGVTVNAVAPGFVETRLTAARGTDDVGMPNGIREGIIARIPVGRAGRPEDIAAAVAFFCSPAAGYVTGQVLEVHGGLTDMTPPTAALPR